MDESTRVSSGGDAEEIGTRSYKNSWMRYAVLGGLLVILGVLGYMLYEKRTNANKETVAKDQDGDSPILTPRLVGKADPRLKPAPVGLGPTAPGKGETPAPKGKAPSPDELNKRLVGNWEFPARGETHAVVYNADGTYSYSVAKSGKASTVAKGKWSIEGVTRTPTAGGPPELTLAMEWTAEGKPAVKENAVLTQDGTLRHKVLAPIDDAWPEGVFNRKPG